MLSILLTRKTGSLSEAIDNKTFFDALAQGKVDFINKVIIINDKQYDLATLAINGILGSGVSRIIGIIDASPNPNYPAAKQGDAYYITVAGKVGGAAGINVQAGNFVYALADNAGGDQGTVGGSWSVTDVDLAIPMNAVYVDGQFGNDATAERNTFQNKFKTIAAAQRAALPGDTIIVLPGTYNESTSLGVNGLNYFFYPGSVTGAWNDAAGTSAYNVMGHADMISPAASVLSITSAGSTINFQCKSMTCSAPASPAILAGGGSKVTVDVFGDITHTAYDAIQSVDANTGLYIAANRILAAQRGCVVMAGSNADHKQYVYAKELQAGSSVSWSDGGYQELRAGKIFRNADSLSGGIVLAQDLFPTTPIVRIYGAFNDNSPASISHNNDNGQLYYEGDITSPGNNALTGANGLFRMKGDLVARYDGPAFSISGGKAELNGRVINNGDTVNAHGIYKTGGILVLNNTIITTAHPTTLSINADAAQNVVAYSSLSNRDKSANVTVQAGTLTYDQNVQ